jgi:hypothetical protein
LAYIEKVLRLVTYFALPIGSLALMAITASCATVENAAPRTIIGRVVLIRDREAETPELMGAVAPVYKVSPLKDPSHSLLLIQGTQCPFINENGDELFEIKYAKDKRFYVNTYSSDPPGWTNNLVIVSCRGV